MEIIGIIIVVWILFKIFGSSSSDVTAKSNKPSEPTSASFQTSTFEVVPKPSAKQPVILNVPAVVRKPNWQEFEKLVTRKQIKSLYHFTDKRNIPSIRKHGGLYSWSYCDNNGIVIPFPASNDLSKALDKRRGLGDYVRLSFNPFQPMMYVVQSRGVNPCVLEISPEVIYWLDTQFSHINATDNKAIIGSTLQNFQEINFGLALQGKWTTQDEKALIQAEVLVRTKLPIQFIRNI